MSINMVDMAKTIDEISRDRSKIDSMPIKTLEALLRAASDEYYNTGMSILSDELFDYCKDVLTVRDPKNSFLSEVGAPVTGSNKVRLPFPMFSLDKIKPATGDIEKFVKRFAGPYTISDKLDGSSCLIVYQRQRDSWDVKMYRRGTGTIGADISHLGAYLLPPKLRNAPPTGIPGSVVAIRGEVIMSRKAFEKFKTSFKDARGLVNGIINRKTVDESTLAATDFVAYEIVQPRMKKQTQMSVLSKSGFPVVQYDVVAGLEENALIKYYEDRRKTSPYQIDGIVIEDDGPHGLSATGNPVSAFAFKMRLVEQGGSVKVLNVFWEISKDGRLVPRIQYEPIDVNGVVLQFATGYNARFVVDNGLGPGAVVTVVRSGDVIPKIESVEKSVEPSMPDVAYHWNDTHVDIFIEDIGDNDDVKIRRLVKFFQDMGIENISRGLVTRFYEDGFNSLSHYLVSTAHTFMSLPGVQRTLADKLYSNIQTHIKKVPVVKVMAASNIFGTGIGERKLEVVLAQIPDILSGAYRRRDIIEALTGVEGFQRKSAERVADGIPKFIEFLEEHPQITIVFKKKTSPQNLPLSGQIFVFSGFRDKEFQAALERMGAKIATSVTSKTTSLITKETDISSGKAKQARDLNIKIMTKDQLEYFISQL